MNAILAQLRSFCAVLIVTALGASTFAATPCNLRIEEIPGGSEKAGREGTMDVFAVDHELTTPVDPASGLPTGGRQHKPLTILKMIDKATPLLHKALVSNQTIKEAILDFYRIDPSTRAEVKYYTITLKQARVVGVKTMLPTTFLPENESYRHMEEIRLVYEQIEWSWLPDRIVSSDSWNSPAAANSSKPVP